MYDRDVGLRGRIGFSLNDWSLAKASFRKCCWSVCNCPISFLKYIYTVYLNALHCFILSLSAFLTFVHSHCGSELCLWKSSARSFRLITGCWPQTAHPLLASKYGTFPGVRAALPFCVFSAQLCQFSASIDNNSRTRAGTAAFNAVTRKRWIVQTTSQ